MTKGSEQLRCDSCLHNEGCEEKLITNGGESCGEYSKIQPEKKSELEQEINWLRSHISGSKGKATEDDLIKIAKEIIEIKRQNGK